MKKFLFGSAVASALLAIGGLAMASNCYTGPNGVTYCPNQPAGNTLTGSDFAQLINNFAQFLIFTSVVVVVIFIIWAGITYTSAGADQAKVKAAKDRLKQGVIGGLIIFGVGTILATIQIFIQNPNAFF